MPDEYEGIPDADLEKLMTAPQSVSVDGQSVSERSISDIIAADKYLRSRRQGGKIGGNAWAMIGKAKATPPGTQGDVDG